MTLQKIVTYSWLWEESAAADSCSVNGGVLPPEGMHDMIKATATTSTAMSPLPLFFSTRILICQSPKKGVTSATCAITCKQQNYQ